MNFKVKKGSFVFAFLLVFVTGFSSFGQNFTEATLKAKLDSMSLKSAGLNNTVQLSVSGIPMFEFVYSLGFENNLNITIDPGVNQAISYNFFDAKVKDVMVFLYMNFELEYEFTGSIISVKKRSITKPKPVVVSAKQIDVTYNTANEFLSMNLEKDTLWKVCEKITKLSDKNFVLSPDIRDKQVNAFFQNRPYEQVLDMFVKANGLTIVKEKDGFFTIASDAVKLGSGSSSNNSNGNSSVKPKANSADFILVKNNMGNLDVFANNVDLIEIVKSGATEVNARYVLHSTVEGKANLDLKNVTFNQLLSNLFSTTKYNYFEENKLYVIGELKMEGIRRTEMIRMENRTVENVMKSIPKELLADVNVSEFLELNGLIVSGSDRGIIELKNFLLSVDVVVPMIQIDIMLIATEKTSTITVGHKAGLGTTPMETTGNVGADGLVMNLGASAVNSLLNAINGFGVLNLGQVTQNFFTTLSAMENNGDLDIESTPKISTLNGQKASISIGETTYYQEVQVNVSTSVTQQGVLQSKSWKAVDANLTVNIQPFVSSDEQITLTIKVTRNEFGAKVDPSAPPNQTTQTFESMVRVKNGEVILLGGLEKKKNNKTGSGVPFLQKIPIIKWFFSNRSVDKYNKKLHILIKPTVTY
jgi:type IV pilus assembly protein PilQ